MAPHFYVAANGESHYGTKAYKEGNGFAHYIEFLVYRFERHYDKMNLIKRDKKQRLHLVRSKADRLHGKLCFS